MAEEEYVNVKGRRVTFRDKPPIGGTALMSWRDGIAAVASMPQIAIVSLLAGLATAAVDLVLWPSGSADKPIEIELASFGVAVVKTMLFAPLAIAVHRYVLLGEVTRRYALDLDSDRYKNFVLYGVILEAAVTLPSLLKGRTLTSLSTTIVLLALAIYFCIRLILLFPAIAIDAPGAHPMRALQNIRGHGTRLVLMLMLVWAVPLLPFALLVLLLSKEDYESLGFQIATSVIGAPLDVLFLAAIAALASHLYRSWSRQPLPPAATIR